MKIIAPSKTRQLAKLKKIKSSETNRYFKVTCCDYCIKDFREFKTVVTNNPAYKIVFPGKTVKFCPEHFVRFSEEGHDLLNEVPEKDKIYKKASDSTGKILCCDYCYKEFMIGTAMTMNQAVYQGEFGYTTLYLCREHLKVTIDEVDALLKNDGLLEGSD